MTSAQGATPVFDGLSITEHAQRVAESIRAINHLSMHSESTPDPAVIYRVVMELHIAASRLPQAFQQLDRRLRYLARTRGIDGCDAGRGGIAPLAACFAADHADALSDALQIAARYLGTLFLRDQIEEEAGR
ncbi:hypothetical protein K6U06_05695 [Acidiferrimicrobium sp. IK]|uniref:hypothetical protein n=1 Tax=Acidiferrimicrobium sp. IK TaxID=2871700 RepID=UPI0021CAF0CF|nr:hypothetical protein [Acidiferrimicrobium sp. IK]MCU4183846.1 hypothetical protein [Acidiferrimicrobium sp. IK]